MQKLKNCILDKLMIQHVTSAELNVLIYISHYQADRGNVTGVYYRTICEGLHISYQTFYDALRGLEKKNIIMARKGSYYDWDILILDNDFSYAEAEHEGYISMGHDIFHNPDFYALKTNEKLLAMYAIKIAGAGSGKYHIGVANFYDKFCKLLRVTKRVLQKYLTSLKVFFSIGIKDHKYWITPLKHVFKKKSQPDKYLYADNITKAAFRRNKAKYSKKEYLDTMELVKQYIDDFKEVIGQCFSRAIEKSIFCRNEGKNNKYKWDYHIHPAYVHKLLREELKIN